jgi:hypothetical protein
LAALPVGASHPFYERLVVRSGAGNLGLLMRSLLGKGRLRGLQAHSCDIFACGRFHVPLGRADDARQQARLPDRPCDDRSNSFHRRLKTATFTTCCQEERVAIAWAIVTDPDLILADGNLDAQSAQEVLTCWAA